MLLLLAAAAVFGSSLVLSLTERKGSLLGGQLLRLNAIDKALAAFVAENGRLPCPANPTNPSNHLNYGIANDGTPVGAGGACSFPTGVVPWKTLGLPPADTRDNWGYQISYRVYDGQYGLVQPDGMNAVECDATNAFTGGMAEGATTESPPNAYGLCINDQHTLLTSFLSYGGNQKGLTVSDTAAAIVASDVAYVLISHGPTGRGAYSPSGSRRPIPSDGAADLPNVSAKPIQFLKAPNSDSSVDVDAAGFFDDVVFYARIGDVLKAAKRSARDWPDTLFTSSTTSSMTTASLNPTYPHLMTTGTNVTGQAFTANADGSSVTGGTGVGAFSACLWWPNRLTLVAPAIRRRLNVYLEFAAADNASDPVAGFTAAFLSGTDPLGAPNNSTCGTGIAATTTANGAAGQRNLIVASTAGIVAGQRAFGNGIPFNATVSSVSVATNTVRISANTTSAVVAGRVSFADGNRVRRDLGWEGGNLDLYTNRFAAEFDANRETPTSNPPGNDPTRPHLAVDYDGVVHATDASSCTTVGNGLSCDSQVANFPAITVAATGTAGGNTLVVVSTAGIASGMTVTGTGIPAATSVTSVSGTTISLTSNLTGNVSGNVTFASLSTANFLQNGSGVFHSMRIEVSPYECLAQSATGSQGATTITVADTSLIHPGMTVFGIGIAPGAKVSSTTSTQVTLSSASQAAVTGNIIFAGSSTARATGSNGTASITVPAGSNFSIGQVVFGSGIGLGSLVTGVSGTTVNLSIPNTAAVNGNVTTSPPRTLIKSWTLSNTGCAQDPVACAAMKDIGSDFGDSNSLNLVRTASGTSGSTTVTVSDTTGIQVGMAVRGSGISATANVASISGTTITLSAANTASVSNDVVFRSRQLLHAVDCVPTPTTTSAYDSLYFGLTTSSVTTNAATSKTATGLAGSDMIVVSNNTGIVVGMFVRGTGIGNDAAVTAIAGTTITLSAANSGDVSGTVSFAGGPNVVFRNLLLKDRLLQ
jgi:hypothetical protein